MDYLFFTDLDGTLLDHDDYSFQAAEPALERLRQLGIPLVLVSSKTRSEMELLRRRLRNADPFVVENGAAIFLPPGLAAGFEAVQRRDDYEVIQLGVDYGQIRRFVEEEAGGFGVRGFGDMSDAEVAAETGLSLEDAALARRREFTEPFLLDNPDALEGLREAAARRGLALTRGGRFHHLIGEGQDKGRAVRTVVEIVAAARQSVPRTVGLGDSPTMCRCWRRSTSRSSFPTPMALT